MPQFHPQPIWKDEEVFIIGGGPSLRGFDWSLLINEHTIGCNNAFRLGPEVCDVCIFVDRRFIFEETGRGKTPRKGFYDELEKFPNLVVTNDSQMQFRKEPWINWMQRKHRGMFFDGLGYNFSCGATAINLALLLGATTVYLLGYDMHLGPKGRPNYHDHVIDKPKEQVYIRMLASFGHVSRDLKAKFPGCRVFNINKDSKLTLFPVLDPDEFWSERKKNGTINYTSGGNRGSISSLDSSDSASIEENSVCCETTK